MRIRSHLFLLILAVLVPAAIGAAIAVAYVHREQQAFQAQTMQEAVRAMALALDREMARRETVLRILAQSPSLADGNLARFHAHASSLGEREASFILSDLEGRPLLDTRLPVGASLPRMLPMEPALRAAHGATATLVSDLYRPATGPGPYSFAIQAPVLRDGRVTAFLSMTAPVAQLQHLLAQQELPAGWHAAILDRQGVLVARSVEPDRFVGLPARPELRSKLAAQPAGSHRGMTLAGIPSTVFYSRAPQTQWTFLLAMPDSAAQATVNRATLLLAGITALLLAMGLAGAWWMGLRISAPAEALRRSAEALGRGEPVQRRRTGIVELDAAGDALAGAGERLRAAQAELERRFAHAVSSYEQSQRQLLQAQKLEALGRLTGGIAHDFNNVLQALATGLQSARTAPAGRVPELLARCQRAVARGSELARQLMVFARAQEVRARALDTATHLEATRPLLKGAVPSSIAIDEDIEPGLWPVSVDPAQFELALLNLVMNARDAMPQGGTIVLRAGNRHLDSSGRQPGLAAGDYVVLALGDTGEGMPPDVVAQAREPFFTTRAGGRAQGMGLAQADAFARQAGGMLELHSEPGQGTTATLWLPRAGAGAAAREGLPLHPQGCAASRGSRVLLVEDDELVRDSVAAGLRAAGFEVEIAATADEAARRLDAGEPFRAVFTDIVVPGALSGADLARHVRARHPGIGVVMATGYGERTRVPGVRALPKPFGLDDAVGALNEAVAG